MKKTLSLSLVTLLIVVAIFSCSKKTDVATPKIAAAPKISQDDFLKYMVAKQPSKYVKMSAYAWHIIKEDLEGGGVGMGMTGNPAFGFAMAGLFSYMADFPPHPAKGANRYAGLTIDPNGVKNSNFGNSNNQFDYIGNLHNLMLTEFINNPSVYLLPGSTSDASNIDYNSVADHMGSIYSQYQGGSPSDFYAQVSVPSILEIPNIFYNTIPGYGSAEEYLLQTNKIDEFVYTALNNYISTLVMFTNYNDFHDYSVSVETALISSNASESDKKLLLTSFAVARYSAGFWLTIVKI
jgi:hypothetical protein